MEGKKLKEKVAICIWRERNSGKEMAGTSRFYIVNILFLVGRSNFPKRRILCHSEKNQ